MLERAIDARDWARVIRILEEDVSGTALIGQEELIIGCIVNDAPLPVLQLLIQHGADCNEETAKRDSPLMIAVFHKKPLEVIQALVEKGRANVNARNEIGNTALILASVVDADPAIVRYLVQQGADVNLANKYDNTPLYVCAAENRSAALARALMEAGAKPNARDQNGNTCLILACERNGNDELVRELLTKSNVNAQNLHGNTALGMACWKGCRESLIRLLIQAGANVLLRNHDLRSPVQLAKDGRAASKEVIALLEEAERNAIHAQTLDRFSAPNDGGAAAAAQEL